jgi:hypothetical protein
MVLPPLSTFLRHSGSFLVGCCVSRCRLVAVLGHRIIDFVFFIVPIIVAPNDERTPSHTLYPGRASSPTSPLPLPPTIGWLLCVAAKWRPPKAEAPFPLYFLKCLCSAPQTREPAIAPPNPTTGALRGTIGSRGAIGWGRR